MYLLLQIANAASETDLIRELRAGVYKGLLPETSEEFRHMIHTLTIRKPNFPKPFLNGFLHLSMRWLKEHKKSIR